MGEKLLLDPKDPFFEPNKISVTGVAGSCYCCSQQIRVSLPHLEELPLAKINKKHFYVFLCDQCEDDIKVLNETGIDNVSYDVLWIIQEPLENELFRLEENNGGVTSIERDSFLIKLYKETERKMNNKSSNKYLESLSKEELNETKLKK